MLFQTVQLQLKRDSIITENQVLFFLVLKALILCAKAMQLPSKNNAFGG